MKQIHVYGMILILILIPISGSAQVSYRLRALNQYISGDDFFFQLYIQSIGDTTLYLAGSQVLLDFNHGNFSPDSFKTVETGSALAWYSIGSSVDVNSRINIQIGAASFSNPTEFNDRVVLISPNGNGTYIGKFRIHDISNPGGTAGLAWYYFSTPANGTDIWYFTETVSPWNTDRVTSYSNVDPTDTSLPVQLGNLLARMNKKSVTISWQTESQMNSAGFHVWRSESQDGVYLRVTTSLLPSCGNISMPNNYSFTDRNVMDGVDYWYKVEHISTNGTNEFFGPIYITGEARQPKEFGLSQNYPNPFNPETTFEYWIPEACEVMIQVYSIRGEKVRDLLKKHQKADKYTATWDGKDDFSRKVTSGTYILYMRAGNFEQLQRMTVIH